MSLSPFEFVLASLATWRLASLLAGEAGPYRVLPRLRQWVAPPEGVPIVGGWLRLRMEVDLALACVWCSSLWLALPMLLVAHLAPWLVAIMAVSAVAIAVERVARR